VVKTALEGLKGVERADVSFRTREAVVAFDPAQVSIEQMLDVISHLGFRASINAARAPAVTPKR
jgi:copper chaperone CopZ